MFEWDEKKNRTNLAKHGIGFDLAREAFDDPFAITTQDRDVDGEQRYQLIGAIFTRIILVAYAVKSEPQTDDAGEDSIVRIISARKATPGERKRYEENSAN